MMTKSFFVSLNHTHPSICFQDLPLRPHTHQELSIYPLIKITYFHMQYVLHHHTVSISTIILQDNSSEQHLQISKSYNSSC